MKLVISVSGLNAAVHDRDSLTGGCNHYKIRNTLLHMDFNVFKCYLPRSDQVSPLFLLHSSLLNKHLAASTSPPPSLHILSRPPRRSVQIYHSNTGQANDLPCSMVPQGTTVTHNSPISCWFQPLTATFKAHWKYGWGVIWVPLSHIVWLFMLAGSLGFKEKKMPSVMTIWMYRCKNWMEHRHGGF